MSLTNRLVLVLVPTLLAVVAPLPAEDGLQLPQDVYQSLFDKDFQPTVSVERSALKMSVEVTLPSDRIFYTAFLAALTPDLDPNFNILRNALVIGGGLARGNTFGITMPLLRNLGEFHVQAVILTADPLIAASNVVRIPADRFEPRSDDGSGDASDDDIRDLDRIQCELAIGGEVPSHFLRASFVAHSDSYRLLVAMVRQGTSERVTEVYLILKTPGKGEGTRDVVEYHDLAVPLGRLDDGGIVRVLATEIVGPLPDSLDEIVEDLTFETKAKLEVGG